MSLDYDLFVHGLDVGPEDEFLDDVLQALEGKTRPIEAPRWRSTGTITGDIFNMTRFWDVIGHFALEYERICDEREAYPKTVIAHSMGQVVAANAIAFTKGVHFVTVGGPMSHPFFGRWMRSMGLWRDHLPSPTTVVVNPHDPICAFKPPILKPYFIPVKGAENCQIPKANDPPNGNQHHISVYLKNSFVQNRIMRIQ